MNAIRSEKIESTETEAVDTNLAAVTEVEAGIRDFVRNDIAYLRRPVSNTSAEPMLDAGAEATVSMQARKGRASYLGPRSVGHEDPGAASTALILAALRDAVTGSGSGPGAGDAGR